MQPKERAQIALSGGRPDRVPFQLEADSDYVAISAGWEPWEFTHGSGLERARIQESCYLRHAVDLWRVSTSPSYAELSNRTIVRENGQPIYVDTRTGRRFRIDRRGGLLDEKAQPVTLGPNGEVLGKSLTAKFVAYGKYLRSVESEDDILELLGPAPPREYWIEGGRLAALGQLVPRHGSTHFLIFSIGMVFADALDLFGGFEEGLTALYAKRPLFHKTLAAIVEWKKSKLRAGAALGADGAFMIECCAGADTISPPMYREFVYPYEREVIAEAHRLGLKVLLWYLGDLMPLLGDIVQLGADALFPEQGRKGYEVDMVEIRRQVGERACLVGFNNEDDLVAGDQEALEREMVRQIEGAGQSGALMMGTTIATEAVRPEHMDAYVGALHRLGRYSG